MSLELVAQAYRTRTGSGVAKSILVGLADQANADGLCWPSITYICERAEWDEKTVRRCIASLEAQGHISVVRRNGRGNLYHIHPKAPEDPTPVTKSGVIKSPDPGVAQVEKSELTTATASEGSSMLQAADAAAAGVPEPDQASAAHPTPVTKSGVEPSAACGQVTHTPVRESGAPVTKSGVPRSESPDTPVRESTESSLNRNLNRLLISEAPDGKKRSRESDRNRTPRKSIAELLPAAPTRRHAVEPTVHDLERQRAAEVQRLERAMAAKGQAKTVTGVGSAAAGDAKGAT